MKTLPKGQLKHKSTNFNYFLLQKSANVFILERISIIMKLILLIVFLTFVNLSLVYSITQEEQQSFDKILEPLSKIYSFIKYAATLIASLFLVFSGVSYMAASNDVFKKDKVKMMIAYIIVGLSIIWAAPYIVDYLLK